MLVENGGWFIENQQPAAGGTVISLVIFLAELAGNFRELLVTYMKC